MQRGGGDEGCRPKESQAPRWKHFRHLPASACFANSPVRMLAPTLEGLFLTNLRNPYFFICTDEYVSTMLRYGLTGISTATKQTHQLQG